MGYCFETTEKILGPCQPMDMQPNYKINVREDKKKCTVPNIQERKKLIR